MRFLTLLVFTFTLCHQLFAAVLPPHSPLRILIVSDEVNPHGLSNSDLTQPGDLSVALTATGNGLSIDEVTEIPTNDIHLATALLNLQTTDPDRYDVLIYFAHRIPNDGSAQQNQDDQDDFTDAVELFLQTGGGVVCFHHGAYFASGKEGILSIVGATANGSVPWNTGSGQNVINVSPSHFVTTNSVEYSTQAVYADATNGIVSASYDLFNNTPDERYPNLTINNDAETIEHLFASNYTDNGSTHILGFTHQRSAWQGRVVFYQPGEYQPNALDDVDGNNFQILANAIYYSVFGDIATGVNERASGSAIEIFPNPSEGILNISVPKDEQLISVQVINALGQTVLTANSMRIDLGELQTGVYSVRTETDRSFADQTIVKR